MKQGKPLPAEQREKSAGKVVDRGNLVIPWRALAQIVPAASRFRFSIPAAGLMAMAPTCPAACFTLKGGVGK